MKIKESKKMSHKDVLQFFNTLTLIGTSMRGPKEESDVALTAFYSLIISRRSVVAYITRALAPIGLEKFMPTHELIAYIQKPLMSVSCSAWQLTRARKLNTMKTKSA